MKNQVDMKWEDIQERRRARVAPRICSGLATRTTRALPPSCGRFTPRAGRYRPTPMIPTTRRSSCEGSVQVTRRWYHEGDIRIVKGGTVYGPVIAGPEGATVLIIFRGGIPINRPPKPDGQIVRSITPLDQLV